MMHIIDLHGEKIEVDNLQLEILQADDYRHYQLGGSAYAEYNRRQQTYWEDIYIKLRILEKETENH